MQRVVVPLIPFLAAVMLTAANAGEKKKDVGYVKIFDGKSLDGWHISSKSGHSSKSGMKSGGKWVVVDGVITGTQDEPGNGGIIVTDKKYKNFEVVLEMKNDFGLDSGLFLAHGGRQGVSSHGRLLEGGNLMGIYGEGLGGFHYRNYSFLKTPDKITADIKGKDKGPTPLPVSPEKWAELLEDGRMERTEGQHRRQSADREHVDQWRQVHGMEGRKEAARRRRRHCAASTRRGAGSLFRQDGALSQYSREVTRLIYAPDAARSCRAEFRFRAARTAARRPT